MAQRILYDFHIDPCFTHSGGEGMAKNVATEGRKQNRVPYARQEYFIITITNDTSQCFIQRALMLGLSKAIDKDEIRISINRCFAMYSLI